MHYLSQNKVIQFSFKNIFHDFALVCVLKRSVFHLKSNWAMRMRVSVCECVCVCVCVSACECVWVREQACKLANLNCPSFCLLSSLWFFSTYVRYLFFFVQQLWPTSIHVSKISILLFVSQANNWMSLKKSFFYLKTTVAEFCL
jgi:hypothetical protein